MKLISKFLVLIFGITTTAAIAQKADSVIVIYQNQKSIIPLPASGSQSSVSYADSNKVVEIGVWVRKPGELSPFPQFSTMNGNAVKSPKRSKWFSKVEAGYVITIPAYTYPQYNIRNENFRGYKIGFSVREKERFVNNKISIVSGVNLAYIQSFRHVFTPESNDQVILYSEVFRSSFANISFPISFKYHVNAFDLPANIHIGANLVYGYLFISRYDNRTGLLKAYDNALIFLEPNMGIEISKLGLNFASGRNLFPGMSIYNPIKSINSFSVTYRLF